MDYLSPDFKDLIRYPCAILNDTEKYIYPYNSEFFFEYMWDKYIFNGCKNPIVYYNFLKSEYEYYKSEIILQLNQKSSKVERLLFIKSETEEIIRISKALKYNELTKRYSHTSFRIEDSHVDMDSNIFEYFQNHFSTINIFIKDALKYFSDIEALCKELTDSDFNINISSKIKENNLNLEYPIKSIEDLLTEESFQKFKYDFYPSTKDDGSDIFDEYLNVEYDEELEMITFEDYDYSNILISLSYTFKMRLSEYLEKEKKISIRSIDYYIIECDSVRKVRNYLQINLNKLFHLKEIVLASELMNRYAEIIIPILTNIEEYVTANYKSFIKSSSVVVSENDLNTVTSKNKETLNELRNTESDNNKIIYSFKWTTYFEERTLKLFDLLKEKGFIAKDTDFTTFIKAFDGSAINNPLNIKWIKTAKSPKYTNKPSLLELLDLLQNEGLIEKIDCSKNHKPLYEKINSIFVDKLGNKFKNLKVSNSASMKTKKLYKKELENIIHILKITVSATKSL